jgi:hypothetical protein
VHNVETLWTPLSVDAVVEVMRGAGFLWCLAGGHAIERVVGRGYRQHEDIDVVVLRSQLSRVQEWFHDWHLAAADTQGCLRAWESGEKLPWRIHDMWGHRREAPGWELQLMIQEDDAQSWYFRRDDRVYGDIADLVTIVDGVPCLRMDLQLLYKSKSARLRDEADFQHLLPHLSDAERQTLAEWLRLTSPNGHLWIEALEDRASG